MNESPHPFANQSFLELLETTNCVGDKSGWVPHHFELEDSFLPSYIKFHSYGEYIFDWAWANFYEQNNLLYYPKLIHAIPFTPVNAPKFLGNKSHFEKLAKMSFDYYKQNQLSSEHYLFINNDEQEILEGLGFSTLLTHQYHFYNRYQSFDEFLERLKKNKRKNIKKERKVIAQSNLIINKFTKKNLTEDILEAAYLFYISTIIKKGSYAYLTKEFFTSLQNQNVLLITANKNEELIAMALFFYSNNTLYGRNWGIHPKYEYEYPFLHFELCYYQGIDFCIDNNLELFEAGAQGEHKLTRGFEPIITKSAHHIKMPQFYEVIKRDIQTQNEITLKNIEILKSYLPFK